MEKISGVPNWIQNKGFCPYLKFVSLVFLNIAQDCSLGQWLTSSRVESSKNNIVTQIVGEMIFSVLMSSSIHSNLLVITNIVIFSGSIISVTNIILFYVLISFKVNSFIILFYFWNSSRPSVRLSVRRSVRPSVLKFSQVRIIIFFWHFTWW